MTKNIFDPQKCEPYLSAFGKQALQVISKLSDDDNGHINRTNYDESIIHRKNNTRILTFIDESLNPANINARLSPPIRIYNREQVLNSSDNMSPQSSTTIERIETLHELHAVKKYNNYLHPTSISSSNIVDERFNNDMNNKRLAPTLKIVNARNDENAIIPNVNWDNMFDSELCDFNENKVEDCITKNNHITLPSNILSHKEDSKTFNENFNQNIKYTEKRKRVTDECNIIRKKNKNHNLAPEIVSNTKKCNDNVLKQSVRKQKYRTTVNNWLNNIHLYNTHNDKPNVEEAKYINNNGQNITENKQHKKTKKGIKITIDKTTNCTKKIVQAQLVNKDGIMKFTKPLQEKELQQTERYDVELFKDETETLVKKLFPPIICETNVRQITYHINVVDEINVNECRIEMDSNVIVTLIYRNMLVSILDKHTVICYEGSNLLSYLSSRLQMDITNTKMFDVKIGASLLEPDNPPESFSDLQKQLGFTAAYTIVTECTLQKAAWYMSLLHECWIKLKGQLEESQLWHVFVEIEMKLLPIISEMEGRGVAIDVPKLKSMEEALLSRMKQVELECYKAAKKKFQINSSVQVRSILYEELQLDTIHNIHIVQTSSTRVKSTSETALRSLMTVHPLPKLILEYRRLHKAHSTFLAGIAQHVNDGIVKPTWVQTAAATGRIASNNPNLQAIPKAPFTLVMFPNTHHNDELCKVKFRSVYVARAGRCLLAADFQQVECRVFAHVAADERLLAALAAPSDLFRELAAHWLKIPKESVSSSERDRCKRLVYASMYGAGVRTISDILDVNYEHALRVTATFHRTFPSLKSFGRHLVSQCTERGGRLATLSGRLRQFAHIASEDFALRSHAQRQAVNFVVQGSAADLCKTAMILTEEHLRNCQPPIEAYLLLQIHDELVWEVNETHLHRAAEIIKRVMEECGQKYGMSVSLPVDITVGKNWADMQPYRADHHSE